MSQLFVNSTVFFPLVVYSIALPFLPGAKSQEQTSFTVLERDLSTVHPALFSSLDDIGRSQVEQLLRRLGVKSWSARELINSHIIPTFQSSKWKVTHEFVYSQSMLFSPRTRQAQNNLNVTINRISELPVYSLSELLFWGFKAEHSFKQCLV